MEPAREYDNVEAIHAQRAETQLGYTDMLAFLEGIGATNIEELQGSVEADHVPLYSLETFNVSVEKHTRIARLCREFGVPLPNDSAPLNEAEQHSLTLLKGHPETTPQRIRLDAVFIPSERNNNEGDVLVLTDGLHRHWVMQHIAQQGHPITANIVARPGDWFTAMTSLIAANDGKPELSTARRNVWYEILWQKTSPEGLAEEISYIEALGMISKSRIYDDISRRIGYKKRQLVHDWVLEANKACNVHHQIRDEEMTELDRYNLDAYMERIALDWAATIHDSLVKIKDLAPEQGAKILDYASRKKKSSSAGSDSAPAPRNKGYTTTALAGDIAVLFPKRHDLQNRILNKARDDRLTAKATVRWAKEVYAHLQRGDQESADETLAWSPIDILVFSKEFDNKPDTKRLSRELGAVATHANRLADAKSITDEERSLLAFRISEVSTALEALIKAHKIISREKKTPQGAANDPNALEEQGTKPNAKAKRTVTPSTSSSQDDEPRDGIPNISTPRPKTRKMQNGRFKGSHKKAAPKKPNITNQERSGDTDWGGKYGNRVSMMLDYVTGASDDFPRSLRTFSASHDLIEEFYAACEEYLSEDDMKSERYQEIERLL